MIIKKDKTLKHVSIYVVNWCTDCDYDYIYEYLWRT